MRRTTAVWAAGFFVAALGIASAQDPPPPTPTPAASSAEASAPADEKKESIPFRPIESNVIVNLPSVDVAPKGTLQFLVTHRFQFPIQEGNINNFFTLDVENRWGFGLWYVPVNNLNVGFYRSSDLNIYEASAEYALPRLCGFASSLRVGEDWRTDPAVASPHSSFFAQAILAYSFGKYVRITAVPTYLQRTNRFKDNRFKEPVPGDQSCKLNDQGQFTCSGLYDDIFNVPFAASVALTHSITLHGEVYPRLGKVNSSGVGWTATVEKSLLRHRFAFFVGNMRPTTVDQYAGGLPYDPFPLFPNPANPRPPASNVYIGFNLYRAWKLD